MLKKSLSSSKQKRVSFVGDVSKKTMSRLDYDIKFEVEFTITFDDGSKLFLEQKKGYYAGDIKWRCDVKSFGGLTNRTNTNHRVQPMRRFILSCSRPKNTNLSVLRYAPRCAKGQKSRFG